MATLQVDGIPNSSKHQDETSELWSTWSSWPYLAVNADLGSDALSGYQALQRHCALNCDLVPDVSHGVHNDVKLALSATGLYGFFIVAVCAFNLPWGPDRDEFRYQQIREAVIKMHSNRQPWQMPIFQAMAPKLLQDLRRQGVELPHIESEEAELWQYMKERAFNVREGRRISMCRFLGAVEGAERAVERWYVDTYETLLVSLETDLFKKVDLAKVWLRRGEADGDAQNEAIASTSSRATTENKSFRSACENAIMVRASLYSDDDNRRLVDILASLTSHLRRWNGEAARSLRSCAGAEEWRLGQTSTGFQQVLFSVVKSLSTQGAFEPSRCRPRRRSVCQMRRCMEKTSSLTFTGSSQ